MRKKHYRCSKQAHSVIRGMTGKLLLDMGKLTFGSFVLGGVLRGEVPRYILLVTGSVVTAICIFLGLWLSEDKPSEDKKE